MIRLAYASLRSRGTSLLACLVSIFLGSMIMTAFVSLLDTGMAGGVSATDQEALVTMAAVIGGWGLIIVLFSVASTLGVAIRQRGAELSTLRTIGTTNRQVRTLVRRETGTVALVAATLALLPGWLLGRLVLSMVKEAGMVDKGIEHHLTAVTMAILVVVMVVASLLAATLASRRATKGSPRDAQLGTAREGNRIGRARLIAGIVVILIGVNFSVLTLTIAADAEDPYFAMAMAGEASIWWSLGLALLSPLLLRGIARVVGPPLKRLGVPLYLAVYNAEQRALQLSSVLMPIIILTGIGTGTLYLMSIQNEVGTVGVAEAESQNIEMLNYVVTGMITVFAAIMVVNAIVAATNDRRREFGQQRLIGLTNNDVTSTVAGEGALLAFTGIVFGGMAALGTIIPFAIVRTDGWLPGAGPALGLGVMGAAAVVTLATSVVGARRAVRTPAIEAALAA